MPQFVVEDRFEVKDRGPVMARSLDAAKLDLDAREMFRVGDIVTDGKWYATVVGIETFPIAGSKPQPQQAIMLRGVSLDMIKPGSTWKVVDHTEFKG